MRLFIDSDIFVRDIRYKNDKNYSENASFLNLVKNKHYKGFTSIINLLEVCGILSFNLSHRNLMNLYAGFRDHYNLEILFLNDSDQDDMISFSLLTLFEVIGKKFSFGDALVAYAIERHQDILDGFVTWNAIHFKDKLDIKILTPNELIN